MKMLFVSCYIESFHHTQRPKKHISDIVKNFGHPYPCIMKLSIRDTSPMDLLGTVTV